MLHQRNKMKQDIPEHVIITFTAETKIYPLKCADQNSNISKN